MDDLRLLDRTLGTIEENLALDEAILLQAEAGEGPPILRFWEVDTPCVVLGASGRLRQDVDVDACRADGVAIARRASGGGTVLLGRGVLNFAIVLPVGLDESLASVDVAQRWVLERVAESLRRVEPGVEVLGSGDLAVGRRKFSGSAQRRLRRHLMVHASILDSFPLDLIPRYLAEPARQPSYRQGRPHGAFLTNLGLGRDRLREAIRAAWGPVEPAPAGMIPEDLIARLVGEKYADPAWVSRL